MVSYRDLAVHINTQEEACEVVAWFEEQGAHTEGLTPDVYLEYPFFYIYDRETDLLSGTTNGDHFRIGMKLMEYEEWVEMVNPECAIEIDDDAFYKILQLEGSSKNDA